MKFFLPALVLLFTALTPVFAEDAFDTSISQGGDPVAGRVVFQKCQACHNAQAGQPRLGPNLDNIFGRIAGTDPGYAGYSKALRESGIIWSEKELDQWLQDPNNYLPGNKMPFAGLRSEQDRADLMAYLRQATENK